MRMIDADAIPWEEHYVPDLDSDKQWDQKKELCVLKPVIDQLPTVDAVEVVRCKDCRYCMQDYHGLWCFNDYEHNLQPNDFCSHGEKKDGDWNG